jgi:hypothetical protein
MNMVLDFEMGASGGYTLYRPKSGAETGVGGPKTGYRAPFFPTARQVWNILDAGGIKSGKNVTNLLVDEKGEKMLQIY